jgi:hypothetical protein
MIKLGSMKIDTAKKTSTIGCRNISCGYIEG